MTMTYFTSGKFGSGPAPDGFGGTWETAAPPGYAAIEALGIGASPVTILHAQADTSQPGPDYLVELSDGSSTEYIGVNSLRDVTDLLARWAPVATASILSYLCDLVTGPGNITDSTLARLIGRIRADDREGVIDQAESDILAARRESRQEWMARQATPVPEQAANGNAPAGPVPDEKASEAGR
jgi:hypothetical protein